MAWRSDVHIEEARVDRLVGEPALKELWHRFGEPPRDSPPRYGRDIRLKCTTQNGDLPGEMCGDVSAGIDRRLTVAHGRSA